MGTSYPAARPRRRYLYLVLLLAGMAGGLGLRDMAAPHAPAASPAGGVRAFTAIADLPVWKASRASAAGRPQVAAPAAYLALAEQDGDDHALAGAFAAAPVPAAHDAAPALTASADLAPAPAIGSASGGLATAAAAPGGSEVAPGIATTGLPRADSGIPIRSASDDTAEAVLHWSNESAVAATADPPFAAAPVTSARATDTSPVTDTMLPASTAPVRLHTLATGTEGDVASVPEPASWLTMIAGFALVGCGRRRVRARVAAQALIPSAAGRR